MRAVTERLDKIAALAKSIEAEVSNGATDKDTLDKARKLARMARIVRDRITVALLAAKGDA